MSKDNVATDPSKVKKVRHTDVSSLNDKDAKIMKSVCCAMSIEILTD